MPVSPAALATAAATPARSARELYDVVPSPIGDLLLAGDGASLTGLHMIGSWTAGDAAATDDETAGAPASDAALTKARAGGQHAPEAFAEAREQLAAYFAGELTEFQLGLAPRGTPFQLAVWQALREIPYGTTATYGEIAATVGRPPSASRSIGAANGSNPIAVIVPCHRVIGAGGSLVGFGGGLERKRALLTLEGAILV